MPVIKLWCLPRLTELRLRKLHQSVVHAVVSVPELGLKTQNDMTVLFPTDMMKYGLGEEILIEVTGLFVRRSRTPEVRARLANHLGRAVQEHLPNAMIEVFVYPFKPEHGFWTSKPDTAPAVVTPVPKKYGRRVLRESVETLALSLRTEHCLKAENMQLIGDLVVKTEIDLLKTPNLSRRTVDEIKVALAIKKLKLAD